MDDELDEITITGLDDEENTGIEDDYGLEDYNEEKIEDDANDEEDSNEEKIEEGTEIDEELKQELEKVITKAMLVRENAHHNNYKVGAVLKMRSGNLYTGCNINNQDIMSICAERVAFAKAITRAEDDFEYILVVGGPVDGFLEKCLPCGYCRQFMSEFVDEDFKIYNYYNNRLDEFTIKDLLPEAFEY